MNKSFYVPLLALLTLLAAACGDIPTQAPAEGGGQFSVIGAENPTGAIVLNRGAASEPYSGTCHFSGRFTNDVTIVGTPNGGAIFKCHWTDFPASDFGRAVVLRDWTCDLTYPETGFFGLTDKTTFVLSESHQATATCIFQHAPVSNGGRPSGPPSAACYGDIVSGIASTWPWAHDGHTDFAPPPGALRLWIKDFGVFFGITSVRELQMLFCGP